MLSNNPIKLVADGKLMEFDSLEDFYLKLFQMLREDFPRGYIDYKLFLYEHTPLRGEALLECCKGIEHSWADSENCCFKVHWTYPVQTRDRLTDFLRKASKAITPTSFARLRRPSQAPTSTSIGLTRRGTHFTNPLKMSGNPHRLPLYFIKKIVFIAFIVYCFYCFSHFCRTPQ